jgi:hypothetical protein
MSPVRQRIERQNRFSDITLVKGLQTGTTVVSVKYSSSAESGSNLSVTSKDVTLIISENLALIPSYLNLIPGAVLE